MPVQPIVPKTPLEIRLDDLSHIGKINDFYVTENEPLAFKLNGQVFYDKMEPDTAQMFTLAGHLNAVGKEHGIDTIIQGDYALSLNTHRYRVNILKTMGRWRYVLRLLPKSIPDPVAIGVPQHVVDLYMNMSHGLILLTGPTGSGKSTSIAALINYRAQRTQEHVVTLEDPIEYLYSDSGPTCITQREVGGDVVDFAYGIKTALRQSPNIVMVGEIRDSITAEAALQLSETGHVVISTIHTNSVDQTVQRFLKLIAPERVEAAISTMADVLRIVMCQRLLPTKDNLSRVAVHELMIQTSGIASMIRAKNFKNIQQDIETGSKMGQLTWERSIRAKVQEGILDESWIANYASIRDELPEKDESPIIPRAYELPDWAKKLMDKRGGAAWE